MSIHRNDVAPFAATKVMAAYNERFALEDWRAGRQDQAVARYMDLAKTYRATPTFIALGGRTLALLEGRYAKSKNAAQHEQGLLALRERFSDESAAGKKGEKGLEVLQTALYQRHGKFVDEVAAAARVATAKPDQRKAAIAMVSRYLALPIDAGRRETTTEGFATLYAADGNLKTAVAAYQKVLADFPKSEGRNRQLMAAIELQKKVAIWPNEGVWSFKRPAGAAAERETLVTLLTSLHKLRGETVDWSVVSHLGQLERTLGRQDKAFTLFQAALAKSAVGADAAEAAGLMLTTHNKAAQWPQVEALARLTLKAKLAAQTEAKPVDTVALLGDALLNGGRNLYKASKFSDAASKLNEYARNYPKGKDRDEALYLLADAQRRVKQSSEALETYIVLLKDHPKSRFFRGAALTGGDLAASLNHGGTAVDLYDIFLRGYPADEQAPRVRDAAIALNLAKKRYLEVMNMAKDQIASAQVSRPLKERAARTRLKTAEEFSTPETTMAAANTIIAANLGPVRTGEAYAALARMHAARRDLAALMKLEGQLATAAVGDTTPATREALGQARFVMADMKAGEDAAKASKQITAANGLGIERGTEMLGVNALKFTQDALARMNEDYARTCEEPAAGFCTTAMKRLAALARGFIAPVTNLKMSEQFANEQITAQFDAAKKAVLAELNRIEVAAKEKTSADTASNP